MTESNFGYEKINDKEHSFRVRDVFNKVANKYDFMNDVMSLGMQRLWKKTFINSIKSHSPEGLNVVDLANFASCSFIETGDLAREISNGEFEILGRLDRAMLRGCNLMYTSLSQ